MAKFPHLINIRGLENESVDGNILALKEGQSIQGYVSGSKVELFKIEGGVGKVLGSEIELKSNSESKLVEAKAYTDSKFAELMGGVTPAQLDTIKEIADQLAADQTALGAITSSISSLQSALNQAQSDFESALASEESARIAADNALQSQITSAIGSASGQLSGDLNNEINARIAADLVLDGKIEDEEARALAAEGVIAQDLDNLETFVNELNISRQTAETNLDNKITTEKNRAEAAEAVLAQDILDEETARIAGDSALQSALSAAESSFTSSLNSLSSNLTQEIADRQSQDAAKLLEAKAYADQKISDLINGAPSMMDTLKEISDAISAGDSVATSLASQISSEISRAQGEEARIEGKVDAEVLARQAAISSVESALSSAQSSFTSALASEEAARISGDSALSSDIAAKLVEAKSYADTKKSEAQSYADAAVLVEKNRAEAAEEAKLVEAKSYADQKKVEANAYTENMVGAEQTARESADNALDARLDVLEAKGPKKDKLVVSGSVPSYFDLQFKAVADSMKVINGTIWLHEGVGEGYTLSEVNGKTRVTFTADAVALGDKVFFYFDV